MDDGNFGLCFIQISILNHQAYTFSENQVATYNVDGA